MQKSSRCSSVLSAPQLTRAHGFVTQAKVKEKSLPQPATRNTTTFFGPTRPHPVASVVAFGCSHFAHAPCVA
eukprot:246952-Pleurochrysis_carterae.AAC.1